jgi:uncharacterized membrane protein
MADNPPQQTTGNQANSATVPETAAQPANLAQQTTQQVTGAAQQVGGAAQQAAQEAAGVAQQKAQEAAQQAGQAVNAGLQQGVDQLKKINVGQLFKAQENQPKVTTDEKLWGMASYIPMVALLALLFKPNSGYIKLHGRQGLLVFVIFFFCIFIYLIPYIGPLFAAFIQLGLFIIGVYSMYQAFIGNWWKIPVLGDLAEQIPVELFTKVTKEAITGQPVEEQQVLEQNAAAAEVQAPSTEPPVQQSVPPAATPSDQGTPTPTNTPPAAG